MRLKQSLTNKNDENKLRAIESHAGFIFYVIGRVNKIGIETVLQQYQPALGNPTEFYWLKKAYERVLTFAEQYQLKMIPLKHEGSGQEGAFEVIVKIENEDNLAQVSGNRISQYVAL